MSIHHASFWGKEKKNFKDTNRFVWKYNHHLYVHISDRRCVSCRITWYLKYIFVQLFKERILWWWDIFLHSLSGCIIKTCSFSLNIAATLLKDKVRWKDIWGYMIKRVFGQHERHLIFHIASQCRPFNRQIKVENSSFVSVRVTKTPSKLKVNLKIVWKWNMLHTSSSFSVYYKPEKNTSLSVCQRSCPRRHFWHVWNSKFSRLLLLLYMSVMDCFKFLFLY